MHCMLSDPVTFSNGRSTTDMFSIFFSRWQGVKEATKKPNSCVQLRDDFFPDFQGSDIWNPNTKVSEDCLYLNVAVPNGLAYNNASVMASTTMCYLLGRPLNDWTKDKTGIRSTVKLQFSGLGWSAAKCLLFWSCPLFLDLFMYHFLKIVTEESPVKWSYPLFLESAKLEFYCT